MSIALGAFTPMQVAPPPSTPSAGQVASTIGNAAASNLVHVLSAVWPALVGLACVFFAINFVLSRFNLATGDIGGTGHAYAGLAAQNIDSAPESVRAAEDRWIDRVEQSGQDLHFTEQGYAYTKDERGRRHYSPVSRWHRRQDREGN